MEQSIPTNSFPNSECRSCGNALSGKFCSQCGEKILEPKEKSFGDFLGSVLKATTSLDGKFLRTLKIMVARPGEVSYHYLNGKRVPFIKPMSMFFIANLLYFLFPLFNSLNSSLYVQMNLLPHSGVATYLVEKRIAAEKMDFDEFQIRYDQQSTNMAKMALVLLVIYFSLPLSLINFNRKMYYYDHLLVSLEACSLIILLNFVALLWLFRFAVYLADRFGANIQFIMNDSILSVVSIGVLLYLFFQLERRAYTQSPWWAIGKAGLLIGCFYLVLQVYRGSLFFITMLTV